MTINVDEVIEYYKNLLIIQYNGKIKAAGTVGLFVKTLLQNDIYSQVENGYNLDTAIGKQLDVLGGYIGVDRFYSRIVSVGSFFGFTSYSTLLTDTTVGFTDYANYDTDAGGFLSYDDLVPTQTLNDFDYRFILRLRIIQNHSNHSQGSIDDGLFLFFGDALQLSTANNMTMFYFADSAILNRAIIALKKGVLPRPMGVQLRGLIKKGKKFFGFARYNNKNPSSLKTGFTRYGSPKEGQMLTYSKILS